jgi:hypothetical protein
VLLAVLFDRDSEVATQAPRTLEALKRGVVSLYSIAAGAVLCGGVEAIASERYPYLVHSLHPFMWARSRGVSSTRGAISLSDTYILAALY